MSGSDSSRPGFDEPNGTISQAVPQTFPPPAGLQLPVGGEPQSIVVAARQVRSGPLPDAAEFRRYKEAHPPAAEWILTEASKAADHVRQIEKIGAEVARRDALLLRILPFAVVVSFMIVSTIIAFINVWVGGAGIAITFTTVVLAYLRGFGMSGPTDGEPQPESNTTSIPSQPPATQ